MTPLLVTERPTSTGAAARLFLLDERVRGPSQRHLSATPVTLSLIEVVSTDAGLAQLFLADVRDGLGPYFVIYLLTVQKWDAANIGIVITISGIAAIVAQTPAGTWTRPVACPREGSR